MDADTWQAGILLVSGIVAYVIAAFILWNGLNSARNRAMIAFTLVTGTLFGGVGLTFLMFQHELGKNQLALALSASISVLVPLLAPVYLRVIRESLPGPATQWMRRAWFLPALYSWMVAAVVFAAVRATTDLLPPWTLLLLDAPVLFASLFALLAAGVSWATLAPGSKQRKTARDFFIAFGVQDLTYVTMIVSSWFSTVETIEQADARAVQTIVVAALLLLFFVLLGRAVLRGEIIDAPRKLHLTINRSTIAGIFIAVFVGVQAIVGEFVTAEVGLAAGGIASAALFVVIKPLNRIAGRLADLAVPEGSPSAVLSAKKKEAFYQEQVEIAYSDGVIGVKERHSLRSVRERLGLSASLALKIEDSVVA